MLLGVRGLGRVGRSWSGVGGLSGRLAPQGLKHSGARRAVWDAVWGEERWTSGSTAPVLFLLCLLFSLPWRPGVRIVFTTTPPL